MVIAMTATKGNSALMPPKPSEKSYKMYVKTIRPAANEGSI